MILFIIFVVAIVIALHQNKFLDALIGLLALLSFAFPPLIPFAGILLYSRMSGQKEREAKARNKRK